ncbi:hypothetical protein [Plasticicumulans acidivorans]|uniref:Uncharacterized protein n=1 Tax=Plasticicumulans acidivorans TaxID=886464 RepID=A0A317MPM4_9GAMM|nr:hypothetical protein [Plasticicumulans acidivorans]PWV58321.1 hypothetical protein C7443_12012 [Plasticicumulans acidivorans]
MRIFLLCYIRLGLLLTFFSVLILAFYPVHEALAAPRWTDQRQISWSELEANGWTRVATDEPGLMLADRRWVGEDFSSLMLNVPPERAAAIPHDTTGRPTTVVFGVYDPQSATGSIVLMRTVVTPDRVLHVMIAPFKPTSWEPRGPLPIPFYVEYWPDNGIGDLDISEYKSALNSYWNDGHVQKISNPFRDFVGHPDGKTFINIQPTAFFAAVGAAAQWGRADHAWVATLDQRVVTLKKTSGNVLRKKVKYTKKVYVKPVWSLGIPAGQQNAGAEEFPFCFPAVECGEFNGVGDTPNARQYKSGLNWHHQGIGHNLPVYETLVFQHSQTYSSWTFVAMVIVTAVLVAVTAGAAAALGGPALAGAVGMSGAGYTGVGAAAAQGAALGAVTNMAWNYSNGVHSLTDTVGQVFASGVSKIESMNPAEDAWDSRPATRGAIEAGPTEAPGATGEFARETQPAGPTAAGDYGRQMYPEQGVPEATDPYTGLPR